MSLKGRAVGESGWTLDATETRRALALLVDPQHGTELRALPSGRSVVLPGSDLDGLVAAAARFCEDGQQVYYLLNPIPSGLGRAARVADILSRRWLLVDIDPVKPESHKDGSATDAEKDLARATTLRIADHLAGLGWPAPVLIDSGNGFHLLYRVDLPSTEHSRVLLKGVLYRLAELFDSNEARVDRSVHNASRIAKLPGSWARKGKQLTDRPWRQVVILNAPEAPVPVTAEQLASLVSVTTDQPEANGHSPLKGKAASQDRHSYGQAALEREVARVLLAPVGDRNNLLNAAAYSLGQLVAGRQLERSEVEAKLRLAAERAGLGGVEIGPTIASGLDAGIASGPRKPPEKPAAKKPRIEAGTPLIVRASTITPRKVEWLWPSRIPLGKLTTFAGQGGLGKTFVLVDISAHVTRGDDWPDGGRCSEDPGQVLFISGEDDPEDTLVPRLIECSADLSRVSFLSPPAQADFTLGALELLTAALGQIGSDTRLVVIDPPSSYLAGVDDHKNAELRSLLSPLAAWAAEQRVAVIFNTHVNKGQGAKVEAMMRVMGSVAWVNGVRAAHMFARDPADRERRLFVPMKNNLGPERKGLAYRLAATESLARVEWLGEVDTTADEAVCNDAGKPRRVVAREWLLERFRERLEWPSDELFRAGAAAGVSRSAIFEAKSLLDLPRARRDVLENGDISWVWWVPSDWPVLQDAPPMPLTRADEETF